jgi:N-ethylmaleimide reductase
VNGWELNPPSEVSAWYSFEAEGYTDFPVHSEAEVVA